jgi:23S rRNA pseudouridine1911/1915/1917 synthase
LIYAKSKSIETKMFEAFRNRLISKKYIAFVHGKLSQQQGVINSAIEGKSALTKYRVLQEKNNYSVMEVAPVTGRTNQIRIHFKHIQHPLVGEDKFAFRKDFILRAKRVCLHAGYLEFKHPQTAKTLMFELPLAQDMQKFLDEHQS